MREERGVMGRRTVEVSKEPNAGFSRLGHHRSSRHPAFVSAGLGLLSLVPNRKDRASGYPRIARKWFAAMRFPDCLRGS